MDHIAVMKKSTLCFCIKENKVLLGMKKRGFGVGKWNGYGGKVQENEEPRIAAIRELEEESGVIADTKDIKQVGIINFYFDKNPVFECHVFLTYKWNKEPRETEEMKPQWYPISNLPFTEMWAADVRWLPIIFTGKKIKAEVNFNTDGSAIKEFTCNETEFN
jgi:ADP-ribose pyrophosphatase YjhB (NUDIX family)